LYIDTATLTMQIRATTIQPKLAPLNNTFGHKNLTIAEQHPVSQGNSPYPAQEIVQSLHALTNKNCGNRQQYLHQPTLPHGCAGTIKAKSHAAMQNPRRPLQLR
jgi:hypothetical protein